MKKSTFSLAGICWLVLCSCFMIPSISHAQYALKETVSAVHISPAPSYRLERSKRTPNTKSVAKEVKPTSLEYFRHHRRLSSTYNGQFIQLIETDRPLPRDYALFRQFGKIYYDQLESGRYAYGIQVQFSSKKAQAKFLQSMVLPRAPEARLVVYKKGKRR